MQGIFLDGAEDALLSITAQLVLTVNEVQMQSQTMYQRHRVVQRLHSLGL